MRNLFLALGGLVAATTAGPAWAGESLRHDITVDARGPLALIEITRALRPVTPQEDLDANLTIDALLDVVAEPGPSLAKLLARKAELIVERAAQWELERTGP